VTEPAPPPGDEGRFAFALRFAAAVVFAILVALVVLLFVDRGNGSAAGRGSGAMTLAFLLVLPAALSAFVSLVTDPRARRGAGFHFLVPLVLLGAAIVAGVVFLREGVICVLMLAPLWLVGGLAGSLSIYAILKRLGSGGGGAPLRGSALLLLPLFAAQLEAASTLETRWETVTRQVVIDAPSERVWPLLASIPSIDRSEGRWNVAQDILAIPRPTEARMTKRGNSLVRHARWGPRLRFEEQIKRVQPGVGLEWRFRFPDRSVQDHTDRHIAPDGAHLHIAEGAYRLERLDGARTRLRLETRYAVRSPLNFYAAMWAELLLGGIQENVLAIVSGRAQSPPPA
jgi:hypothetical protein